MLSLGARIRITCELIAAVVIVALLFGFVNAHQKRAKLAVSYENHLVVEYAKTICGVDFFKETTGELTEEKQDCLNNIRAETKKQVEAITK